MDRARTLRVGGLVVLLGASIVGGFAARDAAEPQPTVFCHADLWMREIDGRTVAIQDHDPNGTACDYEPTMPGMDVLGVDCKVRAPDGTVLSIEESTREDGTCGTDSPAP